MKKNIYLFILIVSTIVTYSSCKKTSNELNRAAIQLVVFPVTPIDTIYGGTTSYKYSLRGTILSPSTLDASEFGFMVLVKNGVIYDTTIVKVGEGRKLGSLEAEYTSTKIPSELILVLYAKMKSGEMLTSSGEYPVAIAPTGAGTANGTDQLFYVDVFNEDVTNYRVLEVGVKYHPMASFTGTYTGYYVGHSTPVSTYQLSVVVTIAPSTAYFAPETEYAYIGYALVEHIPTGVQTYVYGYPNSFISLK